MRKAVFTLLFAVITAGLSAQVFQSAYTISPKSFSLGINPAISQNDFAMYLHGGYGLKPGMDLGIKVGLGWDDPYFGADIKWTLSLGMPSIGVSAGVHIHNNPGFDGTLNITFPLNSSTRLYSGLDVDIIFASDIYIPVWVPIGLEAFIRKGTSVILEGTIGLNNHARHIVNGGVVFYF